MKLYAFSVRTAKEILRDPLTLFFGLGFPLVLLLLLTAIQANIPVSLFEIEALAPGIAVFGATFMTLFSATLLARDRESALLQRLYTTPLSAVDFILGYTLPVLPIALAQSAVCFLAALVLGLPFSVHLLTALILMVPVALFFIAVGLLFGSICNVKQVGGICGALFTNVSAWLSGVWFDLNLIGGVFRQIAYALPFVHAVELEKAAVRGDLAAAVPHLLWVLGYAAAAAWIAVYLFLRQMKRQ